MLLHGYVIPRDARYPTGAKRCRDAPLPTCIKMQATCRTCLARLQLSPYYISK